MSNQKAIELYSNIYKQFESISKNFDKLYPNKASQIILKKAGVVITIDYKDFKNKKNGK